MKKPSSEKSLSVFNEFIHSRKNYTTDEWINHLITLTGIDASLMMEGLFKDKFSASDLERLRYIYLARLIPFVVPNYNFLELGPKGTGRNFFYSQNVKYSICDEVEKTSRARIIYNKRTSKVGKIGECDSIAFFGDLKKFPLRGEFLGMLKVYMDIKAVSIGNCTLTANSSLSFLGNFGNYKLRKDQYIEVQYDYLSTCFDPPFYDRINYLLLGNDLPNINSFRIDIKLEDNERLFNALHLLFLHNETFLEILNDLLKLDNSSYRFRDLISIKKTVLGYLKLIFPIGNPTQDEFIKIVNYSILGRRKVRELLYRMLPSEFEPCSLKP